MPVKISERRRIQKLEAGRKYNANHRPPKFKRFNHNGDPITKEMIAGNAVQNPLTGCLNWTRSGNPKGYGKLWDHGRLVFAHRKSYELWVGPIPDGLCVLHHCDNPSCVNHDHLFIGGYKENRIDCVRKGRHGHVTKPETIPRGEGHGHAVLTNAKVLEIRRLHAIGINQREIGRRLSVNYKNVNAIVLGKIWRHIL